MHKEEFMRYALAIAHAEDPTPNPRVGALVVKNGRVIGEGAHKKSGEAHAEVIALKKAGNEAHGADLYVTLEPCCYRGYKKRTPPCTELIIASKIKKVFIASLDTNPLVRKKGIDTLKKAGIETEYGILKNEEFALNKKYHYRCTHKIPWAHLKQAVSLDGFISKKQGVKTEISSKEALVKIHQLRTNSQAIVCGGSTIIADNPQLTSRYNENKKNPTRIIIEGKKKIPLSSKIFDTKEAKTLLYTKKKNKKRLLTLKNKGVEIIPWNNSLQDLFISLLEKGFSDIIIEAGGKLSKKLLQENLIAEVSYFYSPILFGKGVSMNKNAFFPFDKKQWIISQPKIYGKDILLNFIKKDKVCLPA